MYYIFVQKEGLSKPMIPGTTTLVTFVRIAVHNVCVCAKTIILESTIILVIFVRIAFHYVSVSGLLLLFSKKKEEKKRRGWGY